MKSLKRYLPLIAVLFLSGCFQLEDELTIAPDGSGKVHLTFHCSLPDEVVAMMGAETGRGGDFMYPPINEAEARRFFPGKDFALTVDQKNADDGRTLVVEAIFKDVNALLASPYGRAHQLTLRTNGAGLLVVQALSGGSTLVEAGQAKPEGEMAGLQQMPGLEEAQKKKGEMRVQFRLNLPSPATASSGARDNKSVTWTLERAKCKDDEEFAAKVAAVLEASCSAEAIRFSPVTPPRLGLLPFAQLSPATIAATTPMPGTNKILSTVKFVPCALQVTRTIDLSGEGAGHGSQASLTGALLVPVELAPQRWGEARLDEVVDDKGASLMPKREEEPMMQMVSRMGGISMPDQSDEEDKDETAPAQPPSAKPHLFSFGFKAPEWKVKQLAKIKGAVELQYLGGSEVIKLSNAVPANLLMDTRRGFSSVDIDSGAARGQIANARLAELGLTLRVQMAMVQSGMTMLSLETGAGKASLLDAQVFDVEGRPWPTTIMSGGFERNERSCEIVVAGKPKPPFSLAVTVGGVGASVEVPIVMENVPLVEK